MNGRKNPEIQTARVMIDLFCRQFHHRKPCRECDELLEYVKRKIEQCPYADGKPACSHCTIHCYRKDMRSRIREVMRYSGPRMIYRHPILALRHLLRRRNPHRTLPSCFPEKD